MIMTATTLKLMLHDTGKGIAEVQDGGKAEVPELETMVYPSALFL